MHSMKESFISKFIIDEINSTRSKSMVFSFVIKVRKTVISENDFVKKTRRSHQVKLVKYYVVVDIYQEI